MAKRSFSFEPSSQEQLAAVVAIENNPVTFLIGEAGTGKTHVAVSMAVQCFLRKEVSRIVVCRPAVESGEKLGFLPGTAAEKIEPFMVPVMGLLKEFSPEMCDDPIKAKAMQDSVIEQIPIAHMRGRTFNDCFVILDEAQNSTRTQMKMVLTRLGIGSKIVVTGDMTQCDLPYRMESGLIDAVGRLQGVEGVEIVKFTSAISNHRHPITREILKRYE